jgi:hypothetical protein
MQLLTKDTHARALDFLGRQGRVIYRVVDDVSRHLICAPGARLNDAGGGQPVELVVGQD